MGSSLDSIITDRVHKIQTSKVETKEWILSVVSVVDDIRVIMNKLIFCFL